MRRPKVAVVGAGPAGLAAAHDLALLGYEVVAFEGAASRGPASVRPRVIDSVRGLGVEIRGLTAEEERLDLLYRELIAETDANGSHEETRPVRSNVRHPGLAGVAVLLCLAVACGTREPEPAPLDTRGEQCASCRMAVSNARFAAQIVAPGELPRFFDDVGCLGDFVRAGKAPANAASFVADHRTKAWVRAEAAVFTRVPGLETPMSSHLIAHLDGASRNQDAVAGGGTLVAPAEIFGPAGAPRGATR